MPLEQRRARVADAREPLLTRPESAEAARILSRYRRLVLLGKVRLPFTEARRLVGPDCAYHLYFRHARSRPSRKRRPS